MRISKRIIWVLCSCLALAIFPAVDPAFSRPASAPKLTHALAGHEKCLACHAVKTGMKPAPDDHADRTADLCLLCHVTKEGKAVAQAMPEKPQAEFCLRCHGPFDKLAKFTKDYVTDQDEKVNPHVYVPHQGGKITVCSACHEVHALPVIPAGKFAKANVQYCYATCHHKNDFAPCVQCHKDQK